MIPFLSKFIKQIETLNIRPRVKELTLELFSDSRFVDYLPYIVDVKSRINSVIIELSPDLNGNIKWVSIEIYDKGIMKMYDEGINLTSRYYEDITKIGFMCVDELLSDEIVTQEDESLYGLHHIMHATIFENVDLEIDNIGTGIRDEKSLDAWFAIIEIIPKYFWKIIYTSDVMIESNSAITIGNTKLSIIISASSINKIIKVSKKDLSFSINMYEEDESKLKAFYNFLIDLTNDTI